MPTKKHTVSVRLDHAAAAHVAAAARLTNLSQGAFLQRAGADAARRVVLDEAVRRYRHGDVSLSELAAETALAVEEIVDAVGPRARDTALDLFLASCRTAADLFHDEELLRLAEEAAGAVRAAAPPADAP